MRPTSTGAGVTVVGVLLLVVGVALGYPELLAIGMGALTLVTLSALALAAATPVSVVVPGDLRVERESDSAVRLAVRLDRRRALGGLRLRAFHRDEVVGIAPLRPGADNVVAVPIDTSRRGRLTMGPWRLERSDPWGLVTKTVVRVEAVPVLVVPRVHAVTVAQLPMADASGSSGEETGATHVATLREYVVGDELRHVHWRSSAKAGTLMVRQYVDSRRPGVDVVVDLAAGSYATPDDFEEAVDAAASIATAVATTGVPTRVITTRGDSARAGHGRHAGMLDLLADVHLEESSTPGAEAPAAARATGTTTVYVTGTAAGARGRGRARRVTIVLGPPAGASPAAEQPGVVRVQRAVDLALLPSVGRAHRRSAAAR